MKYKPYEYLNYAEFDIFGNHTKFTAIFYTEDGVLSGNITLMQNSVDDEHNIYISFPYNNQFCQRRENTRIPMHVDVEIYTAAIDEIDSNLSTANRLLALAEDVAEESEEDEEKDEKNKK